MPFLGTGTLITGTTNNPETVTGLTPETGYEFYVQSDCGLGDFSTWSGPFSFTTPCAAIIAPYTEDVETHATSTLFTDRTVGPRLQVQVMTGILLVRVRPAQVGQVLFQQIVELNISILKLLELFWVQLVH